MIKNSKILIVDDEPRLCNSLKILLSTQSYKVKICNSGGEALTYLINDEFDLVLLDIFMEDMNGFQVIERLKNQNIDTPVIIMTGNTSAELTVKAFRMGAIDYLKKPFETDDLFSTIQNFLTQRLLKKENQLMLKKLIESEKKYRTLFDSSADSISIIDLNMNKFIDCNNMAVKLHDTGDREHFIGKRPDQLSPEFQPNGKSSRKLSAQYIQETLKEGRKVFEWTHCKNDGTPFPVIVTLSAMTLNGKNMVMCIARDISQQKQAEQGREKLLKAFQKTLENVKTLTGLLPICSNCKKIRDNKGYWNSLEAYFQKHSHVSFSHGMCSECSDALYGGEDWYTEMKKKKK